MTAARRPCVDVIIPAYNRARVLPRAIESVLGQTAADRCTVWVIDDGSTDDTATVVARYGHRVRYVRQANGGAGAARNNGLRHAGHEFVAFLDSDDVWLPRKTERQLAIFAAHPELVFVAGRWFDQFANGFRAEHPAPGVPLDRPVDLAPYFFADNSVGTSTVIARRRVFRQSGLFSTRLPRAQDYHMWTRLACCGPGYVMDEFVTVYAADTPGSLQRDRDAALRANLRARLMLRGALRRRPDCRPIWRAAVARQLGILRDRCYGRQTYGPAAWHGTRSLLYQPRHRPRWEWGRPVEALWQMVVGRGKHTSGAART